MRYSLDTVRAANARILSRDRDLAEEIRRTLRAKRKPEWLPSAARAMANLTGHVAPPLAEALVPPLLEPETIVQRVGRPVLAITRGDAQFKIEDADSQVWRTRLQQSAPLLHPAIAAIGRVEAGNLPMAPPYIGTGWLIDEGVIVTNRHVALEFAERGPRGFSFKLGFDRKSAVSADIDFLEEIDNPATARFDISDILFIARDGAPDVAFLKLSGGKSNGARPIKLSRSILPAQTIVATIGYPARDPYLPDQKLMEQVFGSVFDKKRLAPGFLTGIDGASLTHDCTTLGGNSGSAVVDLATGEAAGLHFAGIFLKTNYAVPAPVVNELWAQTAKAGASAEIRSTPTSGPAPTKASGDPMTANETTFVIPLQITVTLGTPAAGAAATVSSGASIGGQAPADVAPPRPIGREEVERAVIEARRQLARRADVVAIEPGYRFRDGWITDERCVVISVKQKLAPADLAATGLTPLPTQVSGVPVDVAVAPLADAAGQLLLEATRAARVPVSNYQPRPDLPLNEIDEEMTVVAHAGPDAGWPILSAFLDKTEERLTVGMYEFTAPHIVEKVKAVVGPEPRTMTLVLQNRDEAPEATTANDLKEEETVQEMTDTIGDRLTFAWASVSGPDRLFDTSYHIKVAVRDGKEFWLSSGSWRSSNQAPFDPIKDGDESPPLIQQYDRDWHVVVTHTGLADLLEKHLSRDQTDAAALEEAAPAVAEPELWVPEEFFRATEEEATTTPRYRSPLTVSGRSVRVQPLLTPDNYASHVYDLIGSASKSVYFQNQSLDLLKTNGPAFDKLLGALLEKQQDSNIDVKIIFRRFGDPRPKLTLLKDYGFDTSKAKIRAQTNCHTKGIIIDGETVCVGSQNWTNSGVAFNRDASLIFFDPEIAQYYQDLFLYDWNRIAGVKINEAVPAVELVKSEESVRRPGRVRVPWSAWFEA